MLVYRSPHASIDITVPHTPSASVRCIPEAVGHEKWCETDTSYPGSQLARSEWLPQTATRARAA